MPSSVAKRDRAEDEDEARALRVDEDAAEHAGRRDHRADREVDARGRDDERHADGEHADHARLGEHVADVVPGRERVRLEDRARRRRAGRRRRPSAYSWSSRPDRSAAATARPAAGGRASACHATSSARTGASIGRDGVAQQLLLGGGRRRRPRPTISPSRMTRIARADADELLELGRDDEHAEPGLGEVGDEPVDLGLRRRRRRRASARRAAARGTRAAASARARPSAGCRPRAAARRGRRRRGRCSARAAARATAARSARTSSRPRGRSAPRSARLTFLARLQSSTRPCDLRSSGARPRPACDRARRAARRAAACPSTKTSPSSGVSMP